MPKRTVFSTTAILSLCGLLTACSAEEGQDELLVSSDHDGVAIQAGTKMDSFSIKQTSVSDTDTVDSRDTTDTTDGTSTGVTYGPVITIKPKG